MGEESRRETSEQIKISIKSSGRGGFENKKKLYCLDLCRNVAGRRVVNRNGFITKSAFSED